MESSPSLLQGGTWPKNHEGGRFAAAEKGNNNMKKLEIQRMPQLPFDVAEALNHLRINLSFCGDQIKTVMVTSSIPNEGKSFIAMQL